MAEAENELFRAKNEGEKYLENLLNLLNIKDVNLNLIDEPKLDLFEMSLDEAITRALDKSLELKQKEKNIEEKREVVCFIKSQRYPRVEMNSSLNYSGNKNDYKDSWKDLKRENWNVMLSLNLPIYDGGVIQSKVREAEADLRIAENGYFKVKKEIADKVKDVFRKLKEAENTYQTLEKALSLVKENLELQEAQYKLGNITESKILKYQLMLDETTIGLIKIKIEYEIAKSKLSQLTQLKL